MRDDPETAYDRGYRLGYQHAMEKARRDRAGTIHGLRSWECDCGVMVEGARPPSGKCATCDPEAYGLPPRVPPLAKDPTGEHRDAFAVDKREVGPQAKTDKARDLAVEMLDRHHVHWRDVEAALVERDGREVGMLVEVRPAGELDRMVLDDIERVVVREFCGHLWCQAETWGTLLDRAKCTDCKGSGQYVGALERRDCPTCGGDGWAK